MAESEYPYQSSDTSDDEFYDAKSIHSVHSAHSAHSAHSEVSSLPAMHDTSLAS